MAFLSKESLAPSGLGPGWEGVRETPARWDHVPEADGKAAGFPIRSRPEMAFAIPGGN